MARKLRTYICENKKCGKEYETRKKHQKYCSISCSSSDNCNFNKDGKPHNFVEDKIRFCLVCGKKLHHQTRSGLCREHFVTDEYKESIRIGRKNSNKWEYKAPTNGKHTIYKKGTYKNYWCDSSWELAWVIYHLEHNIEFNRNVTGFEYTFKNKNHKYYPDFIIGDNYFEIKGYMTEKDKAKIAFFPYKLTILSKKEMKYIFEYVYNKYGKDFVYLYE